MKTLRIFTPVNYFHVALCLLSLLASLSACEGTEPVSPQLPLTPDARSKQTAPQAPITRMPTAYTLTGASMPLPELTLPTTPRTVIGQPVAPRRSAY